MIYVTVRQRVLAIKLSKKIKNNPEYAKKIGINNTAEKQNTDKNKKT